MQCGIDSECVLGGGATLSKNFLRLLEVVVVTLPLLLLSMFDDKP